MNFSFLKNSKKIIMGAVFTVSCLGFVSVGYAEAKAFEHENVLRGSYVHTMRNEFFIRDANIYNIYNNSSSWGEVIARKESGLDGSVTKYWLIGDLKVDSNNQYYFNVKRHVIKNLDSQGKTTMHKVQTVNYKLNVYHRMESGMKLEWNGKGNGPEVDINGEYTTSLEYPMMSGEAAMYVLDRFMNSIPAYRNKLLGSAMQCNGDNLAETHIIKLVEQHPDHVVTIGTYQIDASGGILEYDPVADKWIELVH